MVGLTVDGSTVGFAEGSTVGSRLGVTVGTQDGFDEGSFVSTAGLVEGSKEGNMDGTE